MGFQVNHKYATTGGFLIVKIISNTQPGMFPLRGTIEAIRSKHDAVRGYQVGDVITHTIDGFWINDLSPTDFDLKSEPID